MESLKKNEEIVVRPADKGGAIVIQNKEDCIQEGLRQLSNRNHLRIRRPKEKLSVYQISKTISGYSIG